MKVMKIQDKLMSSIESESIPAAICTFPTCFPCRPPECVQSNLSQPEVPKDCGPWGSGFASLGA